MIESVDTNGARKRMPGKFIRAIFMARDDKVSSPFGGTMAYTWMLRILENRRKGIGPTTLPQKSIADRELRE